MSKENDTLGNNSVECENTNGVLTCDDMFTCCDCGGNNCGCAYCWSCNACDPCQENVKD